MSDPERTTAVTDWLLELGRLWDRADSDLQPVVAQARRLAEPPRPLP